MLNSKSPRHPNGLSNSSGAARKEPHRLHGPVGRRLHPEAARHAARTTRTASAACTCTCRGGSTTRSSTSRAATTSRSGGGRGHAGLRVRRRHPALPGGMGGGYGAKPQGRVPALLRRDGRLRRTRRDGAERRLLLRDRSERRGQVRHPGAALPLEVGRVARSCRRSTCRRPSARSSSRWAASRWDRCPSASSDYGLEAGGRIIHEAGATRMGADPKTSVLNEWCQAHEAKNVVVARRGAVRDQRRQELHVDDHGARLADQRRTWPTR